MSTIKQVVTQRRKLQHYRMGQNISVENYRFATDRQSYANRIVKGVADDALGKGFDIVDVDQDRKPIKNNTEAKKVIRKMYDRFMQQVYYEREYGKSLGQFFKFGDEPLYRAYAIDKYAPTYNAIGKLIKATVRNETGGLNPDFVERDLSASQLASSIELITRPSEVLGEGTSVLEPIFDILFSLELINEQSTYYAIRYGAGIRYLKIPEGKFNDANYMANVYAMVNNSESVKGLMALPYATVNGVEEDIQVVSESATQIAFLDLRDLLLGALSAATGIPREVFLGSQTGLRSSETNEDKYFDLLQNLQEIYRLFFLRIVELLNRWFVWYPDTMNVDIEYVVRDTMSDDEKIEQLGNKLEIASKQGFTVPKQWLEEQLGVTLEEKEIDPLGLNGGARNNPLIPPNPNDTEDEEENQKE
ncbi:MAG: hypothetical protein V3V41_07890 [Candidatus Heimdallarchaeota archaeon]